MTPESIFDTLLSEMDAVSTILLEKYADEENFGPAMRKLNERQQRFVIELLNLGSESDASEAARRAGYADPGGESSYVRVQGFRLIHNEKVRAALFEQATQRMQAGTLAAASLLVEVIGDKKQRASYRLKAAAMLLDRTGLHAHSTHTVEVKRTDDRAAKVLEAVQLAKELGMDPRALLGNLTDVLPGDFAVLDAVDGNAKPDA